VGARWQHYVQVWFHRFSGHSDLALKSDPLRFSFAAARGTSHWFLRRDLDSGLAEPFRRTVNQSIIKSFRSRAYGPRWRRSSSIQTSGGKSYL
jgi:hypothetical protein